MCTARLISEVTQSVIASTINQLALAVDDKRRAVSALSQLLAPPVEWDSAIPYRPYSLLTPTGFPVEFSFGNPAEEIRYATEVGGHAVPNALRLELAWQRLSDLGARFDSEQFEWLSELQAGKSLKYGAWAGARHSGGRDRFKLYAEVPLSSHNIAMQRFPVSANIAGQITNRGARLIMLGLTEANDTEFYFGLNGMRYSELPMVFGWFDAQDSAESVIEAIELVCGRFLNRSAKNRQNGFSVKRAADGQWRVSLFSQADDLFGSGSHTRRALLRASARLGCNLEPYAVFSRSAENEFDANRHCMLTFTPIPDSNNDGGVDLRVGLSPSPITEVYSVDF